MKKSAIAIIAAAAVATTFGLAACGGTTPDDDLPAGFKTYTFEAEGVNFSGLHGHGYSVNVDETGLIKGKHNNIDQKVLSSASNGYFVGDFNNADSCLTFTVTADKASADNVLVLRLASEYGSMVLTPAVFEVQVNGTKLDYNAVNVTGSAVTSTSDIGYRVPFADYTLSSKFALNAGENTVKLYTRTNKLGIENTIVESVSPGIDCIKIKSQSVLSWNSLWEDNKLEANLE